MNFQKSILTAIMIASAGAPLLGHASQFFHTVDTEVGVTTHYVRSTVMREELAQNITRTNTGSTSGDGWYWQNDEIGWRAPPPGSQISSTRRETVIAEMQEAMAGGLIPRGELDQP